MKKIKVINIINAIVMALMAALAIVINIIFKFNSNGYIAICLILAVSGVVNLIFIAIKEASVLAYDSKRFTFIIFVSHTAIGVLGYYLVKYLGGYEDFYYLYLGVLIIISLIPIPISYFLNQKDEKKKKDGRNKPKFIVNK